jgi:hypothetical protein
VADAVAALLARAQALPPGVLVALFHSYGKPLDVALPGDDAARVTLAPGVELVHLSVRMPVDVIANDWFVLVGGAGEPLAVPGPLLASLVRARESRISRG